jgi:hypothetical protein
MLMKNNRYNHIWSERLCYHLSKELEDEVYDLYDGCFQYSPYREYDEIMAFVTKCFIERNRQLDYKRTIVQVKMKFGLLTIYYEGGRDPYLDEILTTAIKMAKVVSKKISETYGKGGPWNRKVL